jgi:hypothetical protein
MPPSYGWCYGFAMKRLARILGLATALASCGGGRKPEPTATGTTGSAGTAALYAKKISIGWGFQAEGTQTSVFLQVTDETGRQVSHPIATVSGECKPISPAAEMKAITGCACPEFQLHAVVQGADIVILKLPSSSNPPDPMAREEVTRVKAPEGAAIEAGT